MRAFLLWTVVLGVIVGLGGCGSQQEPDVFFEATGLVEELYAPTISGGIAYASGSEGSLYAIDIATGIEVWKFKAGDQLAPSVIDSGIVYAASKDGFLWALDANNKGIPIWKFQAPHPLVATPILDTTSVYVVSDEGILYAIDRQTGNEQWHTSLPGVPSTDRFMIYQGYLVIDSGMMYIAVSTYDPYKTQLVALDLQTHQIVWKYEDDAISSPEVSGNNVYVGSHDSVVALNKQTGAEVWKQTNGASFAIPIVVDSTLYVGASATTPANPQGQGLYAMNPLTGDIVWHTHIDNVATFEKPFVVADHTYITTLQGMFEVDSRSGEVTQNYPYAFARGPQPHGDANQVLFGGWLGRIYKMEP